MQDGDIGPLQQTNSDTVGDLKSRLVSDWAKLHAGARFCPPQCVYVQPFEKLWSSFFIEDPRS